MEPVFVNKVAASGIIALPLENYRPTDSVAGLDLGSLLGDELILKEKPFREKLKSVSWQAYRNRTVALYCEREILVPHWAFMLVTAYLAPFAASVEIAEPERLHTRQWVERVQALPLDAFTGKKVVLQASHQVPAEVYAAATFRLLPVVQSLMFGEAGASVPVYKRKP